MKQGKLDDDVDALFKVPLTEFISARKTLAARLKKDGHADKANRVKALVKPSISAWTVNQLYWQHRDAFDRLLSTGQNFRQAQSSLLAGKSADLRGPLDARQKALSELSNLATGLLGDAGHNPTPDMVRRITTTLEAMSAYASLPDDLAPGRLTQDIDPPGFESFASSFSGAAMPARTAKPARALPFRKETAATSAPRKAAPNVDARQIEKKHQAEIAAAKTSLQEAKRVLIKARARAQSAEAAQKTAQAEARLKEKQRREAEERLEKAAAESEAAAQRAQSAAAKVEGAAKAVKSAEQLLEVLTQELESLA